MAVWYPLAARMRVMRWADYGSSNERKREEVQSDMSTNDATHLPHIRYWLLFWRTRLGTPRRHPSLPTSEVDCESMEIIMYSLLMISNLLLIIIHILVTHSLFANHCIYLVYDQCSRRQEFDYIGTFST